MGCYYTFMPFSIITGAAMILPCSSLSMVKKSDFTPVAPGSLVEIGGGFAAFVPDPLPPHIEWSSPLVHALSAADRAIGQLAGVGRTLANPHLLLRPFLQKEAVLSSRIEGTRASLPDLLLFDVEPGS